jgi:hypothetical protein
MRDPVFLVLRDHKTPDRAPDPAIDGCSGYLSNPCHPPMHGCPCVPLVTTVLIEISKEIRWKGPPCPCLNVRLRRPRLPLGPSHVPLPPPAKNGRSARSADPLRLMLPASTRPRVLAAHPGTPVGRSLLSRHAPRHRTNLSTAAPHPCAHRHGTSACARPLQDGVRRTTQPHDRALPCRTPHPSPGTSSPGAEGEIHEPHAE